MPYKYKISEMSKTASPEEAAKELKRKPGEDFAVGQVTYSDDGTRKSTITDINPETGAVKWTITQLPGFDKLYDEMDDLVDVAKRVYVKTKDDPKFREFYETARKLRNSIRTHLRNEYPDEYKNIVGVNEEYIVTGKKGKGEAQYGEPYGTEKEAKAAMEKILKSIKDAGEKPDAKFGVRKGPLEEDDVDEVSMSGAAGAYNTPYAFVRKPVKLKGKNKKKRYKYQMNKPSGLVGYMSNSVNENQDPGATLGPGPAAGPDGVTDSAYTKQFKYKLVPKNKNGTYVQKGSGLEVKKLF